MAEDPRMQGIPRAIAVLTAWLDSTGDDFAPMFDEIMRNVEEGSQAEVEMTLGLAKVAGLLLVKTAGATGRSEAEILQEIALKYR